jgi:outer membrane receptor protein involved in Fe transport
LITNVTLSSGPGLIVRQRRNAAAAIGRGVEFSAGHRRGNWSGELAYLFADSRFSTGERIPQTPRHQGSAQLGYQRGGTLVVAGLRSYGPQFEDELNRFLLPGFASVQFLARQRLTAGLSAMLAIENLLDREYFAGFTPTPTVGAPRLWRAGLRWEGRIR